MPEVVGPHGCEYLADGPKLLLHGLFIGGIPSNCQKPGAHTIDEDMEEGDWVTDSLEVWRDVNLTAKFVPLAPGYCVFLENCGRKTLCENLM